MPKSYAEMTPEERRRRNRSNAKSVQQYDSANYHKIALRLRKDGGDGITLEQLKAAAQRDGQSVNAWILDAIRDKI